MTATPPGEGWERRLKELGQARKWAALVEGPLAAQDGAGGAGMGDDVSGDGPEAPGAAERVSTRSVCLRWQEVRGDGLVFSCECAGEGCPDSRPWWQR